MSYLFADGRGGAARPPAGDEQVAVGGGRVWVLALPRTARVRALRVDGGRIPFPLLPAAEQCGYRVYAPGLFGAAEPELEIRSP